MSVDKISAEELEGLKTELNLEKDLVVAMNFFNSAEKSFPQGDKEQKTIAINEPIMISDELYKYFEKHNMLEEIKRK